LAALAIVVDVDAFAGAVPPPPWPVAANAPPVTAKTKAMTAIAVDGVRWGFTLANISQLSSDSEAKGVALVARSQVVLAQARAQPAI
jgi:hypothetical protein